MYPAYVQYCIITYVALSADLNTQTLAAYGSGSWLLIIVMCARQTVSSKKSL